MSFYIALLLCASHATHVDSKPWQTQADPQYYQHADEKHNKLLEFGTLQQDLLTRGASYLDGLRRSLERLVEPSDACAEIINYDSGNITADSTISLRDEATFNATVKSCQDEGRQQEKVRGAALLALYTSKLLQKKAMDPVKEHELVTGLAKLLHMLSRTVGFDPSKYPGPEITTEKSSGPIYNPPTQPPNYMNVSSKRVQELIRCLDDRSNDVPAYVRCPVQTIRPNNLTDPSVDPTTTAQSSGRRKRDVNNSEFQNNSDARNKLTVTNDSPLKIENSSDITLQNNNGVALESVPEDNVLQETANSYYFSVNHHHHHHKMKDPHQDISFLSKYKEGRTVLLDPAGAALTRANVEAINNNPSLQQTQRYGSNYNGLDVFVSGAVRMMADV